MCQSHVSTYVKDYWMHLKNCFRPLGPDIFDKQGRFRAALAMEECNLRDKRAIMIEKI